MAAAAREYVRVAQGLGLDKADALRYIEDVPDDQDSR
jgi:GntR family transcriptional regulator